jgi:beta-mannosidase
MSATVPGDVLSDLHHAGKIGDPLYELNFKDKDQQALWMEDWIYSRTFTLLEHGGSGADAAAGAMLVFDSIKMGARVYVDGILLGTVKDQFLRYTFPLAGKLGAGAQHNVSVVFDHSIDTQGRFMACSGGWDWAPCVCLRTICPLPSV